MHQKPPERHQQQHQFFSNQTIIHPRDHNNTGTNVFSYFFLKINLKYTKNGEKGKGNENEGNTMMELQKKLNRFKRMKNKVRERERTGEKNTNAERKIERRIRKREKKVQ